MSGVADSWTRLRARADDPDQAPDGQETAVDLAKVLGAFNWKSLSTFKDVAVDNLTKEPLDDRTYLMERIIDLAQKLPTQSVISQSLTNTFLTTLWQDLEHPSKSYLGDSYVYRRADGSNNNFLWPHVGKAGEPYARSIKAIKRQPVARPDPGVIFDSVLKRKKFREHPNKISSVLFYVASIIIHDCFHTNHDDFNISDTSSYLDLSPLYGNSEKAQHGVRTLKDGKLKPDCFADPRILGFPPGVGTLLIFFNRFHNKVAEKLAQVDENGRFSKILRPQPRETPLKDSNGKIIEPKDPKVLYDEALFQTARLVTCGLYINIVLKDYVRTILNLNRVDSNWNLDPRAPEGKALFGEKIPEATGNQVSAEFNLVYRWHSCVSEKDAAWTKAVYDKIFPVANKDTPPTMQQFLGALKEYSKKVLAQSPEDRDFAGLKRDASGRYSDDDLAKIWTSSVADVAGAFGANHVPEVLKQVEILGIVQARSWNLASLNEFRKYFKLKPWTSFADMNTDPEVAEQLELLYEHPDNVELYPGIILESAKKPLDPGSGLCTTYTTSRAILSDAVSLVRGDRYYTVDYTTSNLTNYGYSMADYDVNINHGCVFYKLVLAALPNHYTENSIYAHYPLVVPEENSKILAKINRKHIYNFDIPKRLSPSVKLAVHAGYKGVYSSATSAMQLPNVHYPHGLEGGTDHQKEVNTVLGSLRGYLSKSPPASYVRQFFEKTAAQLIFEKTHKLAGVKRVDLIRDVANHCQVHFVSCLFALPLKTDQNPDGRFDAADLWAMLIAVYSSIHPRHDPADAFRAQQAAAGAVRQLGQIIEQNVRSVDAHKHGLVIGRLLDLFHAQGSGDLTDQSTHLIQSLLKTGVPSARLVYEYLIPIAATIAVIQARAFADTIDYFLGPGADKLPEIRDLSLKNTAEADTQIEQRILEALRLNSNLKVYARLGSSCSVQQGGTKLEIPAHEVVECDWVRQTFCV